MGFANPEFIKYPADMMPGYESLNDSLKKRAVSTVYDGFVFNIENIKNELATLNNVGMQYAYPVTWGLVDTEKGLSTLHEKLKEAGMEKVLEEAKKQSAVFLQQIGK